MMTRRTAVALLAMAVSVPSRALPHNNPSFAKAVIAEVPVEPFVLADEAYSAPFDLELPPKTIQLHYEIVSEERDSIRFGVASESEQAAADLEHGGRSPPIKAGPLMIVNVSGATEPFTIRIVAEYIVRQSA